MAAKVNHKPKATHKETKNDTPEINISSSGHMKHTVEELRDEQEAQIPIPQPEAHPPLIRTEIVEARRPFPFLMILVVILVAVLTVGGIWFFTQGGSVFNTSSTEEEEEVLPTPTPSPEIVLSEYPIEIQNGSGISGEASKLKATLEAAEFVVESVGNADNSNYVKTIIQTNGTVPDEFILKLREALEKQYSLETGWKVEEESDVKILVIIGKEVVVVDSDAILPKASSEASPSASSE